MDYVGIDVHKKESQICILAEGGELIERRVRTERGRFAEVFAGRPQARMLLEASTESEWVARCLEGLGHEVVVADPNFAPMYAARRRTVTTDRRDARALADGQDICEDLAQEATSRSCKIPTQFSQPRKALICVLAHRFKLHPPGLEFLESTLKNLAPLHEFAICGRVACPLSF